MTQRGWGGEGGDGQPSLSASLGLSQAVNHQDIGHIVKESQQTFLVSYIGLVYSSLTLSRM